MVARGGGRRKPVEGRQATSTAQCPGSLGAVSASRRARRSSSAGDTASPAPSFALSVPALSASASLSCDPCARASSSARVTLILHQNRLNTPSGAPEACRSPPACPLCVPDTAACSTLPPNVLPQSVPNEERGDDSHYTVTWVDQPTPSVDRHVTSPVMYGPKLVGCCIPRDLYSPPFPHQAMPHIPVMASPLPGLRARGSGGGL